MTNKHLIAASTKPLVLSILSHHKSYGYQIIKNIKQLSDGQLEWSEAMLYPVLKRMESDRLIESEWVILESGRKRKYYKITEKGKQAREETKAQWINVHQLLSRLWSGNVQLELG
ncbi:MAG: PadR family transcriptional regulator [Bacteroidota bacterium]